MLSYQFQSAIMTKGSCFRIGKFSRYCSRLRAHPHSHFHLHNLKFTVHRIKYTRHDEAGRSRMNAHTTFTVYVSLIGWARFSAVHARIKHTSKCKIARRMLMVWNKSKWKQKLMRPWRSSRVELSVDLFCWQLFSFWIVWSWRKLRWHTHTHTASIVVGTFCH